jgi:hypothetical protein
MNSKFQEEIFLSDNEGASMTGLSQAFRLEDMIEKGSDIQVMNIFAKTGPIPTTIEPTLGSQETHHTIVINAQVNDYPELVLRVIPAINLEVLDYTYSAELDMV